MRKKVSGEGGDNLGPVSEGATHPSGAIVPKTENQKIVPSRRSGRTNNLYPERTVTYYQVSTSDLRLIGLAQFGSTLFTSIGVFCLSMYLDYSKDVEASGQDVPILFLNRQFEWGWASIIAFVLAGIVFVIRRLEMSRIISEHQQEATLWGVINSRWKDFLSSWKK